MTGNRRTFLTLAPGLGLLAWAGCSHLRSGAPERAKGGHPDPFSGIPRPRRIVHLVVDGMSSGTLTCADHLSRETRGRGLTWLRLLAEQQAAVALVDMRSLNSLVTDSSAAASTWGCGARIMNGAVNVNSEGLPLTHLYTLFRQAGWHRGLVTTTELTHATPAGFAANVVSRSMGEAIAGQYLDQQVEVLLGGGRNHFAVEKRQDHQDLLGNFRQAGYAVMEDREALLARPDATRWLGLFGSGHLPFTVDHLREGRLRRSVPTLAEMTAAALGHLARRERFILQVEGGRVDHACHANDAAAAFYDMIAFDEALDVCLEFQQRDPRTLLVITTDHGNGNPGLNGMGSNYSESSKAFKRLAAIRGSFSVLLPRLKAAGSAADRAAVLEEWTGYRPSDRRLALLEPHLDGSARAMFDQRTSDAAGLGQLLAQFTGVGFTGTSHTSDYVPLLARGPGSARFAGMYAATRVFEHYTDLAGMDHRNPQEQLVAGVRDGAGTVEDTGGYLRA